MVHKPGTQLNWILPFALVSAATVSAIVLYLFDPSQGGFYPVCLFHRMTGFLCPGCGSLRAIHQVLHGHLTTAFRYNPLLMILGPVGLWIGLSAWYRGRGSGARNEPAGAAPVNKWMWVCLVLAVAFTIWRNIPGTAFAALPK